MFVPILMDMFNHWFAQGAIPGSITKGVITLLKKEDKHVWEDLDDYKPITLLNTELKILALVLVNRLQLVVSDLIGPEQNYAVKGRSIEDNLYLVCQILEGIEDDTKAALINFNQSKAFDRLDHQFLATVFGGRWIRTGVPQMDQHDVSQSAGGGAGERKAFEGFRD